MIYAALLRGINVGGNRKVSMAELKATFEQLGLTQVKTYINSGNVIFASPQESAALTEQIETAITRDFGHEVKVLLCSLPEIEALEKAIPPTWVNDQQTKCDVMFLWPTVDSPKVVDELPFTPGLEEVKYTPGAVIWCVPRERATKSRVYKIIGTPLYKQMTIRNPNTVRKIAELMRAADMARGGE